MNNIKLTPKQRAFADNYIKLGNATQASINAGYSKNTATVIGAENLTKPNIRAYIDERMNEIASKRILTAQEALEFMTGVVRSEIREEVVTTTGELVEKAPDIKDRQRAAEEILKRYTLGNNQRLKDELLEAQVKKMLKEIESETSVEDKLDDFFSRLDGAIKDE